MMFVAARVGAFCDWCLLFHVGAVFLAVHAGVLFFAVVGARFCWLCARDVVLGGCIGFFVAVCYTSHHMIKGCFALEGVFGPQCKDMRGRST